MDRRFGEKDAKVSLEEKMVERFSREHQKSRRNIFSLEDTEDVVQLTHGGRPIAAIDDFREEVAASSEDDGAIDADVVHSSHFGGFEESPRGRRQPEADDGRPRTKKEIMEEVIAKSKYHKVWLPFPRKSRRPLTYWLVSSWSDSVWRRKTSI